MNWSPPMPTRSNYQVAPANACIRTDMEFGAARMRRRTSARLDTATIEWMFNDAEMSSFRDWYDEAIAAGAAWFSLTFSTGDGIAAREVRFTDVWKATRTGPFWIVNANIEVR